MKKNHTIITLLLLIITIIFFAGCITQTNTGNDTKMIPTSVSCSQQGNSEPFIIINPISIHNVGDVFEITGTTNLGIEKKIKIDVGEKRMTGVGTYMPDRNYTYTDSRGYVILNGGDCGINSWSYQLNLTGFYGNKLYSVNVYSEQNRTIINYSDFFVHRMG
jgi:hypothetical protein